MVQSCMRFWVGGLALGAFLPGLAGAGKAQQPLPPASTSFTLEPLVVSARKIEEPIRQVPFSLTALSQSQLQERQIQTSHALYRWIPNFQFSAALGGPLTPGLVARFAGQVYDVDGDIDNVLFSSPTTISSSDRDVRRELTGSISGKLLITPSSDLHLTLAVQHRHTRQRPTTGLLLDDPAFPRNAFNPIPEDRIDATGVGATLEWQLGWGRLTSISGYHHYDLGLKADILDGFIANAQTGLPPFTFQTPDRNVRTIDERNTQWTQEIRLDGGSAKGWRWVGGFSLLYTDFTSSTTIVSQQLANGAYTGALQTTNLAGFGEVTVPLTDRLRVLMGLRYTHEEQDFDGTFRGRPGGAPAAALFQESGEPTHDFVTGRAGLIFDVAPTLTAFATIARGEKPGGFLFFNQFAAQRLALRPYERAATWAYEVGLRGQPIGAWFDLSTALFFNTTEDEQLFSFNPLAGRFDVVNADTEGYGVEVEGKACPVAGLTLDGHVAVLHTEITTGSAASRPLVGNKVPYAPLLTASLRVDYRHPVRLFRLGGEVFGAVETYYVGSRQIDPANSRRLEAYELVHLRIPRLVPGYQVMHEIATAYLLAVVPAEAHVLVVGTGTGADLLMLAQARPGWHFTALDESEAMLAVAEEKMAAAGWAARVRFLVTPMQQVTEVLALHDAATCLLVSHCAPDDGSKLQFLRAIAAQLRPRAPLVVCDYLAASPEMAEVYRHWTHVQGASEVESRAMLSRIAAHWHPIDLARTTVLLAEAGLQAPQLLLQASAYHSFATRRV